MENAPQAAHAAGNGNLLAPDMMMLILTWVTFFILFAILKKYAFKPILEGLLKRENYIRQSLEDADKAKAQLAQMEAQKVQIMNDAKSQAAQIIDDSRKTAMTLAHDIESKAKSNAQDIVTNASAQIEGERQKVRQVLRKESADIAITLAGKILKENTDTDKNRKLIEEALKQI